MKLNGRNLEPNMRGDDVKLLQDELRQLGFQITDRQRIFGPDTLAAVREFQQTQGLAPADGIVNRKTAERMTALLATQAGPRPNVVRGRVLDSNGKGIARRLVVAFSVELETERPLGRDTTDQRGAYEITYTPDEISVNLQVRVFSSTSSKKPLVSSPLILDAGPEETVNLAIGGQVFRGEASFEHAEATLLSITDRDALSGLDPKAKTLLARKSGLSEQQVSAVIEAHKLARGTKVDTAVWFALLQEDTDLSTLLAEGKAAHRARLKAAIRDNIIPAAFQERMDTIVDALRDMAVEDILAGKGSPSMGNVAALLATTDFSLEQKRRFLRAHLDNEQPVPEFWERLKEDDAFDENAVDTLQLTLQLGTLTLNHAPLVQAVRETRDIQNARELAGLELEDWLDLMGSAAPPEAFQGETGKEDYARTVISLVAKAYPTARLLARWAQDGELESASLNTFRNNNPEFEFQGTSVRQYLADNPDALEGIADRDSFVRDLESMHRLFSIVPDAEKFEAVRAMWQADLRSAHAIVRQGRARFLTSVGGQLGEEQALQIYAQAGQKATLSLATLVKYSPLFNQLNPQVMGNYVVEEPPEAIPDWASLFGSLDFCECRHCRSILSPAAYLVDLLQFLERAGAGEHNALEALLERRPDLAHVRLDCANTNTTMPYIDLANEVLENAVANGLSSLSSAAGLQTTLSAEALRASPQHINPAAYQELAEASFPWSLPFNLWHEERAIYLDHLGIKVWEIMDTFHREGQAPEPVDRAAAYFDMTGVEREIIVGASGSHGLGNTDAVLTLMRRSQTSFEELEELLTSTFINPTGQEIVFADGACTLEEASLDLNGQERDHLHRFRRLQKITGLSVFELDLILETLGFDDITDECLIQMAFVSRLKERFGLPVPELLSWWAPTIPTRRDGEHDGLYAELFLNQIVNTPLANVEAIFRLNANATELANPRPFFDTEGNLDAAISALVVGALGITEEELRLLIDTALPSGQMNFGNLSHLYRVASLSRALRLSVRDVLTLSHLTGQIGITSLDLADASLIERLPANTWAWLDAYDRLRGPGFRIDELSYLLLHRFEPSFALPLTDADIAIGLIDLQSELRKLRPEPLSGPVPTAQEIDNIAAWLEENLAFVLQDVDEAMRIIRGSSELTEDEQATFIEESFAAFLAPDTLASLAQESDRLLYVYQQLIVFLSRNVVIQRLAEATGLGVRSTQVLLLELLANPLDASQPAVHVFLDDAFVTSIDPGNPLSLPGPFAVLRRLAKLKMVIDRFAILPEDLGFTLSRGAELGWYDLRSIPVEPVADEPVDIEAWSRLLQAQTVSIRLFSHPFSIAKLITLVEQQDTGRSAILEIVAQQTGWEIETLDFLTGTGGYNFAFPDDFLGEHWLDRLSQAFRLIDKAGVSGAQVWSWNVPEASQDIARNIKNAAKARHSLEQWLAIAPDLSDQLRIRRRDALVDFLVAQPAADNLGIEDSDGLFEHLLIDPAVQPCFLTSRIKQAISSVQLFVHRVFLGLEPGAQFAQDDVEQWAWRRNYRIWEAGRKVFLYPENYAEPELRSDKSPFFQELESTLLQEEVTASAVERAYLRYLRSLDEVARLEIAGHYIEEDAGIVHIFARTRGTPPVYYYRRFIDNAYFTPWEKVEVNIEGNHVLPIVYNRRLWLLWLTFSDKAVQPGDLTDSSPPLKYHQIQLSWSEYRDGGWSSPKTSKASISTRVRINLVDVPGESPFYHGFKGRFYFWAEVDDGALNVYPFYHAKGDPYNIWQPNQFFRIEGCDGDFLRKEDVQVFKFGINGTTNSYTINGAHFRRLIPYRVLWGSHQYAMKFKEKEDLTLWSQLSVDSDGRLSDYKQELILNNTPGSFLITPPHQYTHFFSQAPFFCEDATRSFLVLPKDVVDTNGSGGTTMLMKDNNSLNLIQAVRATHLPSLPATAANGKITALPGGLLSNTAVFMSGSENLVVDRKMTNTVSPFAELDEEEFDVLLNDAAHPQASAGAPGIDFGQITIGNTIKKYRFLTFYHPYTCLFIEQLNRFGVDGLLKPGLKGPGKELHRQLTPNSDFLFSTYGPQPGTVAFPHPIEEIDFQPGSAGAYSDYNWEVFFHIPLLIADRLSQNQRFEEAQAWYHYIFDPTETDDAGLEPGERHRRFWKLKPFFEFSKASSIQEIARLINEGDEEYEKHVARWEADPFNPHLIAGLRVVSYMKLVVMKYLDNLIAWADNLFRRDTIEAINEATQLYILAAQILGRRPVELPSREAAPRTFESLRDQLDVLQNALVSLETTLSASSLVAFNNPVTIQLDRGAAGKNVLATADTFAVAFGPLRAVAASSIFGGSLSFVSPDGQPEPENPLVLYFCIPNNQKLLDYFDTLADRLFKIRNCMNIEGVTRTLALFEPPIDPALLVKAAAAGLDLSSALDDLNAPLPHYRFTYMLQKALEFSNEVKGLGSALLSALEKKDAEALAVLRANNQVELLKFARDLKELNIDEARESLEGLQRTRDVAQHRHDFYSTREFTNASERSQEKHLEMANILQLVGQGYDLAANIAHMIPDFKLGVQGVSSPEVTGTFGGSNVGQALQVYSKVYSLLAAISSHKANMAAIKAGHERRKEDWDFQAEQAIRELAQIDRQIAAAEIRLSLAEMDLDHHELQIEQAEGEDAFLHQKFTNEQLYVRLISQVSTAYFQSYQMAYDLAKQAERAFRYELGIDNTNFIEFGYWDNLIKGLHVGERLSKDIRRMEIAYLDLNRREYELTKHVSLIMLNPLALLQLREEGHCEIEVPEALFDLDYPGHYFRRIKSVTLTIPAVTGPYTTLSCTLRLLSSSIRRQSTLLGGQYARDLENDDPRFSDTFGAIQSIATSSGQNDGGLFELSFRDERYLPFEGAGAISRWQLEMPDTFRQFDYDSISDVILHINYTAREGGGILRDAANQLLLDTINALVTGSDAPGLHQAFSARHEFPTEFHRFLNPPDATEQQTMTLNLAQSRFPYLFKGRDISLDAVHIFVRLADDIGDVDTSGTAFTLTHPGGEESIDLGAASALGNLRQVSISGIDSSPGQWQLAVAAVGSGLASELNLLNAAAIEDVILILHFTISG